MKKFIPCSIIWNGKQYTEGMLEEVPDDLATAIDIMNGAKQETQEEPEEEEKPKSIPSRRQTTVRTEV